MMGPTHILVSTSFALAAADIANASPRAAILMTGGAALTARLADVDQKIRWIKHRGITHWTLFWGLILTVAVTVAGDVLYLPHDVVHPFAIGMGIGYAAHGIADGWTLKPVPVLGPFYPKPIYLAPFLLRVRVGLQWFAKRNQYGQVTRPQQRAEYAYLVAFAVILAVLAAHLGTEATRA